MTELPVPRATRRTTGRECGQPRPGRDCPERARTSRVCLFGDSDQDSADAALVAAAPSLLAALVTAEKALRRASTWLQGEYAKGAQTPGAKVQILVNDALAEVSRAVRASGPMETPTQEPAEDPKP